MTLEEMNANENSEKNQGYSNTMAALKKAETSLPGYSGSYDGEIKSIYDKIVNRPAFRYEYSSDPVYGAYRENYERQGERAMRDSIAQSADLTGGYSSSYAQSVGQQQYGAYLEKLNELMPELYNAAYERYKAEGEGLKARLDMASGLADMEYKRYADGKDWQADADKLRYQQQMDAYTNLYELVFNTGYEPSDEELENAGMSREQASALSYEFKRRNKLLPGSAASRSSGGGGWYSGGSSTKKSSANKSGVSVEQMKIAANTKK